MLWADSSLLKCSFHYVNNFCLFCDKQPKRTSKETHLSRDMWFPTMWHFDMNRLRRTCAAFFKLRYSKWCSVSSLTLIEYSSDKPRLWSVCAFAQADLRLCWSQIQHCWKSHVTAHLQFAINILLPISLVPNSFTTIFGFSLIGRRETIRKTERQRKDVSNLFNRFMFYKGQTCAFIIWKLPYVFATSSF